MTPESQMSLRNKADSFRSTLFPNDKAGAFRSGTGTYSFFYISPPKRGDWASHRPAQSTKCHGSPVFLRFSCIFYLLFSPQPPLPTTRTSPSLTKSAKRSRTRVFLSFLHVFD